MKTLIDGHFFFQVLTINARLKSKRMKPFPERCSDLSEVAPLVMTRKPPPWRLVRRGPAVNRGHDCVQVALVSGRLPLPTSRPFPHRNPSPLFEGYLPALPPAAIEEYSSRDARNLAASREIIARRERDQLAAPRVGISYSWRRRPWRQAVVNSLQVYKVSRLWWCIPGSLPGQCDPGALFETIPTQVHWRQTPISVAWVGAVNSAKVHTHHYMPPPFPKYYFPFEF